MSEQRNKLKKLLKQRTSPSVEREAVTPVDLYTKPQVYRTTSGQVNIATSKQVGKPTKLQVVKYTTHLKPEAIKAIKKCAFEAGKKDYEVMEEAVKKYLESKNS